jgi:hypothetical protein
MPQIFTSTISANTIAARRGGINLKKISMIALVLAVFIGGYFANTGVAALNQTRAESSAKSFVSLLTADKAALAYKNGGINMRKAQTEADFVATMSNLTATKATYTDESIIVKGKTAVYTATVDGLPPTATGRTNGIFTVGLVQDGLSWKVNVVSVS